jgi:hypothetical protein
LVIAFVPVVWLKETLIDVVLVAVAERLVGADGRVLKFVSTASLN